MLNLGGFESFILMLSFLLSPFFLATIVQVLTFDEYTAINDFGSQVFNVYNENAEIFLTGVLIRLSDDDFYFGERNSSNDCFGIRCTEGYMRPVVLNKITLNPIELFPALDEAEFNQLEESFGFIWIKFTLHKWGDSFLQAGKIHCTNHNRIRQRLVKLISMVMDPEKETYSQTHVLLKNLSLFYKDCRVIKESHYFSGGHFGTPLYITVDVSVLIGSASIYQIRVSDGNCKTAIELNIDEAGGSAIGRIFVLPISTLYTFPLTLDSSWNTKIEDAVLRTSILLLSSMSNCTQWSGGSDDYEEDTIEDDEEEPRANVTTVATGGGTTDISLAPSETHITPNKSSTPTKVTRKPFQKPKWLKKTTEVTMVTEETNTTTTPTNVTQAQTQMNNARQPAAPNNTTTRNEPTMHEAKKEIDEKNRTERLLKTLTERITTENEESTPIMPPNVQQRPSKYSKYVDIITKTETSLKHEITTVSYRDEIPRNTSNDLTKKLIKSLNKIPIRRINPKQHRTNGTTTKGTNPLSGTMSPEDLKDDSLSLKNVTGQVSQLNKNPKNYTSYGGLGEDLYKGLDSTPPSTPMKNKEHMPEVETSTDSKDEMTQKNKYTQHIADDAEPSIFNHTDTTDSNAKVEGRITAPSQTDVVESSKPNQPEEPNSQTSSTPMANLGDHDPAAQITDTERNDNITEPLYDEPKTGNQTMPGPEDDGGFKKDDGGFKKDDGGIMKDDGGIKKDDRVIKMDDGIIKKDDREIKKDDGKIKKDDGEIDKNDGKIKKDDPKIKKDDGEIKKDGGEIKKDDGKIKKDDGKIKKDDGEIKKHDGEIQKDDGK